MVKKYQWYSDQWGQPTKDDELLFLLLTVGVFQTGLGWKIAAGKRAVFLRNFCNMNVHKVAALTPPDEEEILADPEMIRNPRKVHAVIKNARAILAIQAEYGSFSEYLWSFVQHVPILNVYEESYQVSTRHPLGEKLAKDLKKRGFAFVGPVVTYMFMKASGLVQDEVLNPEPVNNDQSLN
jgi:DNA-3-methyladenine glycosylase I